MNSPASCPPTIQRQFDSGLEAWVAAVEGTGDYWARALERGASPWDTTADAARWLGIMLKRRRPTWSTPNEVVLESPVVRLRDFCAGSRARVRPTLVLPPQAGHDSCIVDFSERQSQVQTIRAAGLERLWSLDYKGATRATRDAGIEDYLDFVDRCVEHIGGPLNLVGDCQGGWLATIYAALRPENVHTLTIGGAPIDFHAGNAVIDDYVKGMDPTSDLGFYRRVVGLGGGVLKGELMLNGFIAIKPESEVAKQLGLLAHLDDAEHLDRYRDFEDWFKHVQDIPGTFYLWIVEHLFRDNRLVHDSLEIGGEQVDLGRIDVPLNLLAGATDHITPPAQVWALADHASTPVDHVLRRVSSGGHLGLFMGSEALREHWPPLMAAVAAESKVGRNGSGRARGRRATPPAGSAPVPAP